MLEPGYIYCPMSPKQIEAWQVIHDEQTEYVLFGGGAGGAKSFLLWTLFVLQCYQYPRTRYFLGRNQVTDLEESGLTTLGKVLDNLGIAPQSWKYNQIKHELMCGHTGSTIRLGELRYRAADPHWNRLGSKEYTQAGIEECQEIDPRVVDILRARVGRHRNAEYGIKPMILLTANPHKGWLYDEWYDPWRRGELPKYMQFIRSTMADNPFLPDSYRRSVERIRDEATRQRMLDGVWDYVSDPLQIIQDEHVTAAYRETSVDGPARIGADPAFEGYGVDDSCVAVALGNTITEIVRRRFADTGDATAEDQLAELIVDMATRNFVEPHNIRIDAQGPGAGLISVLRSKGWDVTKIYGQGRAFKRRGEVMKFCNLRSQAIYELGEKLKHGKVRIVPKDPKLKAALVAYYRQDTDRWYAVEDKRLTRRRLGRSPDDGDACWMALYDMPRLSGTAARAKVHRERRQV